MMPASHVRSVVLVRHGRTAYNAQHRLQGQVNIPLDEVGRWQVERTAAALRTLYVEQRPQVRHRLVVCSDLDRAVATAHAFADPLGLPVHPDERVRERDFGAWEGMAVDEIAQQYPEDYRSWSEQLGGELKYGAEPKANVGTRGVDAIMDWAYRAGDDTDLFVFSHGAWIAQTLQWLLGLGQADPTLATMMGMRNAHWARLVPLDRSDGTVLWRLMDYNHGPVEAADPQWDRPART